MQGYGLGVAYTVSQRAPSAQELYSYGAHESTATFDIGNPNLNKEVSHNLEFNFQKKWAFFEAKSASMLIGLITIFMVITLETLLAMVVKKAMDLVWLPHSKRQQQSKVLKVSLPITGKSKDWAVEFLVMLHKAPLMQEATCLCSLPHALALSLLIKRMGG